MLRSWTDTLRIYLHPERLVLLREHGWLRPRIVAKHMVPMAPDNNTIWQGLQALLQTILAQPEWQQARARVTLSSHFVRYRIAPWDERLTEDERTVLLRHQYEEVYGSALRDWQLTISPGSYGRPGMACAADPRLLAVLQTACAHNSVRLVSVQPYLMAAYRQWRGDIGASGAWLVFVEQGLLTVALILHGAWHGIRTQATTPGWEQNLAVLLAREALQRGVEAEHVPLYLFWPERPDFKPALAWQAPVRMLNLPSRIGYAPLSDKEMAAAWL